MQKSQSKKKKNSSHLQVVQLVPLLGEVHPPQLRSRPPPPQRLVQVQHRDVREVGHASHGLEHPEALDRPSRVQQVQRDAEREVERSDGQGSFVVRGATFADLFAAPDGGVVEGERGELLAHRRDGPGDLLFLVVFPGGGSRGGAAGRRGGRRRSISDADRVVVGGDGPVLGGRGLQLREHARGLELDVRGEGGLGEGPHGGGRRHAQGRLGGRRPGARGAEADRLAEGLELLLEVCPSLRGREREERRKGKKEIEASHELLGREKKKKRTDRRGTKNVRGSKKR